MFSCVSSSSILCGVFYSYVAYLYVAFVFLCVSSSSILCGVFYLTSSLHRLLTLAWGVGVAALLKIGCIIFIWFLRFHLFLFSRSTVGACVGWFSSFGFYLVLIALPPPGGLLLLVISVKPFEFGWLTSSCYFRETLRICGVSLSFLLFYCVSVCAAPLCSFVARVFYSVFCVFHSVCAAPLCSFVVRVFYSVFCVFHSVVALPYLRVLFSLSCVLYSYVARVFYYLSCVSYAVVAFYPHLPLALANFINW